MSDPALQESAEAYAKLCQIPTSLERLLGHGQDGEVWESDRATAIKALRNEKNYYMERDCYQRLSDYEMSKIHGFNVPPLHGFNDKLQVIEIGIIEPPFILDFAKCYLDFPPDYSEEVLAYRRDEMKEMFKDRYPVVCKLIRALEACGIYYVDARPGNIEFAGD